MHRIHSVYKFELILNGPRIESNWNISSNFIGQSESIRMNPNESVQSEIIRTNNPNESGQSEWFREIPFQSDWFGFIRIDFEWASNWFGLKNFVGLVRIQIPEWLGKFRIGSEWIPIRMNRVYPSDSEKFSFIRIDRFHSDWSDFWLPRIARIHAD